MDEQPVTELTVDESRGAYEVEWSLELFDLTSPLEAALCALALLQNPQSDSLHFSVRNYQTGERVSVDLSEHLDGDDFPRLENGGLNIDAVLQAARERLAQIPVPPMPRKKKPQEWCENCNKWVKADGVHDPATDTHNCRCPHCGEETFTAKPE